MKFLAAACACLCLMGGLVFSQSPPVGVARYEIVGIIDHPSAISVSAMHLNNKGEVAGRYRTSLDCNVPLVSFVWSNGIFRTISVPGAFSTTAESVNERGFVTGGFFASAVDACTTGYRHGFVMSPQGEFYTMPWPAVHSVVNNVTRSGWMTGPTAPCDWRTGAPQCHYYGFLWDGLSEQHLAIEVPDHPYTDAIDVNDRGDVVGGCSNWMGPSHGYRYRQGAYEFIDLPGASGGYLSGTNSAGDVVGRAWFAGQPGSVPFIYQRGQFARIEVVGAEGLVPAGVWDINDLGWISGGTTAADGRSLGYIARPIR